MDMKKTTTIWILAFVTAFAIAALMPSDTSACGTFEMWLAKPASDSVQFEQLLQNLECVGYNYYRPDKHAEQLFNVILEAVRTKRGLNSAWRLFEKYECLPSMRQRPEYAELLEAFGEERCTPEGFFNADPNQLLIVSVSTARIRKGPSLGAGVIDGAPRGSIVKRLAKEGNWYRIKTRWGNVGYVHASCLQERRVEGGRESN